MASNDTSLPHVLIVDDEEELAHSVRRILDSEGYRVSLAFSGVEALDVLPQVQPDLIVLDIIMPELTGIDVCRKIRADPFNNTIPIIFLTARGRSTDIAEGLDAGGDDYLVKPFDVIELPARIRALLRRTLGGVLDANAENLRVGDVALNKTLPIVRVGENEIELTATQHRLLFQLMMQPGRPVSIDILLESVWDYPPGVGDPQLVRAHIAHLRNKIEPEPASQRYIKNVRGRGYMIVG